MFLKNPRCHREKKKKTQIFAHYKQLWWISALGPEYLCAVLSFIPMKRNLTKQQMQATEKATLKPDLRANNRSH